MKVLFVGSPWNKPEDGGSFTFQEGLFSALMKASSAHIYTFFKGPQGSLRESVRSDSIDLVWFTSPYHESVPVPFAVTVWDLGHRVLPMFPEVSVTGWTFNQRELYYESVLPRASLIITGNETGASQIRRCYAVDPDLIHTIPLCVDVPSLEQAPPMDVQALQARGLIPLHYLLYPANFWPHKNHLTAVRALERARQTDPGLKLVLTGADKGNRTHVEAFVKQRKLTDAVVFAGFVERAELIRLYQGALALLYCSLLGPDNFPPLEAMALGCPVICADYPGAHDQIGDAALRFEPLSDRQAAIYIRSVCNTTVRDSLVEYGRAHVRALTLDRYVTQIGAIVDEFSQTRCLWASGDVYRHT